MEVVLSSELTGSDDQGVYTYQCPTRVGLRAKERMGMFGYASLSAAAN